MWTRKANVYAHISDLASLSCRVLVNWPNAPQYVAVTNLDPARFLRACYKRERECFLKLRGYALKKHVKSFKSFCIDKDQHTHDTHTPLLWAGRSLLRIPLAEEAYGMDNNLKGTKMSSQMDYTDVAATVLFRFGRMSERSRRFNHVAEGAKLFKFN